MIRAIVVLFLLETIIAAPQNSGDLESVFEKVFGTAPTSQGTTTPPIVNTPLSGDTDDVYANVFGTPPSSGQSSSQFINTQSSTIVPPLTNQVSTQEDISCTTESNDVGECVPYYLCNNNSSVITDGFGLIDIRVRDGPCLSYMDSCCLVPNKLPPDQPITPAPTPEPVQRSGCGWRNPDGVGFKTTGDNEGEAKFGEFPWMVAILKIEPVNEDDPESQRLNVYVGGGSLIHPSVVLTAAHYVAEAKTLRVRAGEWDTQTRKEIYPYQDRDVKETHVHKDFNKGNLFYDIAVLFLDKPMDLAPNIGVACLPAAGEIAQSGTRCFASGWGKDKFGKEGRYQVILKKVEVPVVDRNTCQEQLRKTRLGRYFELHSSFMCAGGEKGQDTCKGDGGSPLVCPTQYEPNRYVQNGIVAWGIGCGEDATPGVYVDVSKLRLWVDDKVAGMGYDISTYTYN